MLHTLDPHLSRRVSVRWPLRSPCGHMKVPFMRRQPRMPRMPFKATPSKPCRMSSRSLEGFAPRASLLPCRFLHTSGTACLPTPLPRRPGPRPSLVQARARARSYTRGTRANPDGQCASGPSLPRATTRLFQSKDGDASALKPCRKGVKFEALAPQPQRPSPLRAPRSSTVISCGDLSGPVWAYGPLPFWVFSGHPSRVLAL